MSSDTSSQIKVGVIGCGVMGAGHAKFLTEHVPQARVSAIYDLNPESTKKLKAVLPGGVEISKSVEALMKSDSVDAIIIASPDNLHVAHLELAIASNKPTLCEKPIATDLESARLITKKIKEYEQKSGKRQIHFGFMRRFDPPYIELREKINSKKYGQPLFIRTITRNVSSVGATTPGLFTNIAIHDFDIYRWLFKSEWVSVASQYPKRSSLSPDNVADPLIITARLANEILMISDIVAFNNYGYDSRVEVLCEKGSLEIDNHGKLITRFDRQAMDSLGGKMAENWMFRFEAAYINELKAWIGALKTSVPNSDLASADDALAANEACALGIASI